MFGRDGLFSSNYSFNPSMPSSLCSGSTTSTGSYALSQMNSCLVPDDQRLKYANTFLAETKFNSAYEQMKAEQDVRNAEMRSFLNSVGGKR